MQAMAEQIARDLPYPPATVHVSPDGRGLTGLESWFWVAGYSGPVTDVVDELGLRVEVEAVPAAVRWDRTIARVSKDSSTSTWKPWWRTIPRSCK